MPPKPQPVEAAHVEPLARLWHEVWVQSHAPIMPPEFARHRTLESFRARLPALLPGTSVIILDGAPAGFCAIRDSELYQLYVSETAQGTGVAAALLADGEARLAASGVTTAWLSCAIGNDRAARFYDKHGWRRVGTMNYPADTPRGPVNVECLRFEKDLKRVG